MLEEVRVVVALPDAAQRQYVLQLLDEAYEIRNVTTADGWDSLRAKCREIRRDNDEIAFVLLSDRLPGIEADKLRSVLAFLHEFVRDGQLVVLSDKTTREGDDARVVFLSGASDRSVIEKELARLFDVHLKKPSGHTEIHFIQDDLLIQKQIAELHPTGELAKGKTVLQRLLDRLMPSEDAVISRLTQGFSGAIVLRADLGSGGERQSFLVKLFRRRDLWKAIAGVDNWSEAGSQLNQSQLIQQAPQLVRPRQRSRQSEYLVEADDWFAEAWSFRGGFLKSFIDFEHAYVADFKTDQRFSPEFFRDDAESFDEAFLRHSLDWLQESWYAQARVERKALWDIADAPYPGCLSFPPYRLTGWWKAKILSSLQRLTEDGRRWHESSWDADVGAIVSFLDGRCLPNRITGIRNVLVSPVHGDLNARNLLLQTECCRPFVIDFATFQSRGHTLQDFALFETQLKFVLMDRELFPAGSADVSRIRLQVWQSAEDQFRLAKWSTETSERCLAGGDVKGVIHAWRLVQLLRVRAYEMYCSATAPEGFAVEYGVATLYHTLRTLGFHDLPIVKRLYATYSAARLIEFLEKALPMD